MLKQRTTMQSQMKKALWNIALSSEKWLVRKKETENFRERATKQKAKSSSQLLVYYAGSQLSIPLFS